MNIVFFLLTPFALVPPILFLMYLSRFDVIKIDVTSAAVVTLVTYFLSIPFTQSLISGGPRDYGLCASQDMSTLSSLAPLLIILVISILAIKLSCQKSWWETVPISLGFAFLICVGSVISLHFSIFEVYQDYGPVTKGWLSLQPLSPSIMFETTNQSFQASFNNAVGTNISITSVEITEELSGSSGASCTASVNSVPASQLSSNPLVVPAGSTFTVEATCAGADRERCDPYVLSMRIGYSSLIRGIVTPKIESGTIRGTVE